MTDRSDAIVLRYTPSDGPPCRVTFEPRPDGRYERVERIYLEGRWHVTGTELVEHVAISTPTGRVVPETAD